MAKQLDCGVGKMPIAKLKKAEIVALSATMCKHGHTMLEHYRSCYNGAKPERIGYLDIETSNLVADFGIILTYCILDGSTGEILHSSITKPEIERAKAGDEDKALVGRLLLDLAKFDTIVTYYGKRFDVPFIRTRALTCGLEFPPFGHPKHIDMYFAVKFRFRLSSNRLENACRVLLGKTDKTRIEGRYWRGGVRGDKKSLAEILDHNKRDVKDLKKLYEKIIHYSRRQDTSI